jgi:hypothetical protein
MFVGRDPRTVLILQNLGDRARLDAAVTGHSGTGAGTNILGVVLGQVRVHLACIGGVKHDTKMPFAGLASREGDRSQSEEDWQDQTWMPVNEQQRMLPVSSL